MDTRNENQWVKEMSLVFIDHGLRRLMPTELNVNLDVNRALTQQRNSVSKFFGTPRKYQHDTDFTR